MIPQVPRVRRGMAEPANPAGTMETPDRVIHYPFEPDGATKMPVFATGM